MTNYPFVKVKDIFEELASSESGLKDSQVDINKEKFGINLIQSKKRRTYLKIFFAQFNNFFNYILIAAALIVFVLGDLVDFFVILSVVLINSIIGFIQEGRAQKVFEVLQKTVKSEAVVLRNGVRKRVLDEEVVAGDILLLKDGDKIPADARLFESNNLKVNEASLTGESSTVLKEVIELNDKNTPISDQKNMIFKGTYVVSGLAKAVVVGTGINTAIGSVAKRIEELDSELPIKKTIRNLSKLILVLVIIFSLITLFFGLGHGIDTKEIFLIVVALFVSAIPESLPVILTVVLAAGFYRMGKKNVLVKRLQAVDALGQTKVVALDKTGTITKNQMKVEKVYVGGKTFYISGDGYEPKGKIFFDEQKVDIYKEEGIQLIGQISATTAIGGYDFNEKEKVWEHNYGDPTEVALLVFAEKLGIIKSEFLEKYPMVREIPFDFTYKHHSTINQVGEDKIFYSAGAPEVILESSSKVYINGKEEVLDDEKIEDIKTEMNKMTKEGYRVLCMAIQKNPEGEIDPRDMKNLTFVGFVGINDTIRKTVNDSIEALENAGMRAVMITGDHKETAIGIAKKVGIFNPGNEAMTGKEMSELNDIELRHRLENTAVFARVTPEQKLKIISLYKERGEVIAMTGDGVNDVLSLVKADLGVSMGYGATDVAKEAADIILLDNNFGSLASGVLEGRNIYTNIRKTAEYLLSTNIAELFVIMFSVIAGLPVALTAVQILWLNLVTDSFLVAGFAFEPLDKKLSKVKNWKPSKYLLTRKSLVKIFVLAATMTTLSLVFFLKDVGNDLIYAHTMTLAILTILQIYNVYNIKADDKSIFKTKVFNNKILIGGIFLSMGLFLFAMYNPFFQNVLEIKPITWNDWLYVLGFGLVLIVVEEIRKLFSK